MTNSALEGLYDEVHGEIFFDMYRIESDFSIIKINQDATYYYIFNLGVHMFLEFTDPFSDTPGLHGTGQ